MENQRKLLLVIVVSWKEHCLSLQLLEMNICKVMRKSSNARSMIASYHLIRNSEEVRTKHPNIYKFINTDVCCASIFNIHNIQCAVT